MTRVLREQRHVEPACNSDREILFLSRNGTRDRAGRQIGRVVPNTNENVPSSMHRIKSSVPVWSRTEVGEEDLPEQYRNRCSRICIDVKDGDDAIPVIWGITGLAGLTIGGAQGYYLDILWATAAGDRERLCEDTEKACICQRTVRVLNETAKCRHSDD